MKKNSFRTIALACIFTLAISSLAACGKSEKTTQGTNSSSTGQKQAEPVKLTLFSSDLGRVYKPDAPQVVELQKKANVQLEVTFVPNGDFNTKYPIVVASGNIPDITKNESFGYRAYVTQGIYMDVGSLLDQYAPNMKKLYSKELWDIVKYQGKQYAIPYENVPAKFGLAIRQDWLDNLGLKMPTNLDELEDVLKKFTFNDPDKNGKNDTYGYGPVGTPYENNFMPIFGAFGMMPSQNYVKDNKVYSAAISPEFKASVEYIRKLWDEKVLDPEIFLTKDDQSWQKMVQSKAGVYNTWWSIIPQTLTVQLKMNEVNPNAKWTYVLPEIKGKDGKGGMKSMGNIGGTTNIAAKCKNPEAAIKFLDYLASEEGWELGTFGLKGTHYTDRYKAATDEGKKATAEKTLDPFSQLVSRVDLSFDGQRKSEDPMKVNNMKYIDAVTKYNLYTDLFYGLSTPDLQTLGPDVAKLQEQWFIKFVTGAEPLSKWDEYVNQWKAKGGQKILESMTKEYNSTNGKNYAVAN